MRITLLMPTCITVQMVLGGQIHRVVSSLRFFG